MTRTDRVKIQAVSLLSVDLSGRAAVMDFTSVAVGYKISMQWFI